MEDDQTVEPKPPRTVNLNKKFVARSTGEEPNRQPKFVNHITFTRIGPDYYMDVGVVPAEEILEISNRQEIVFLVLERYALSSGALDILKRNLKDIDEKIGRTGEGEE